MFDVPVSAIGLPAVLPVPVIGTMVLVQLTVAPHPVLLTKTLGAVVLGAPVKVASTAAVGKTACIGERFMLQVGGMQAAVIAVPPGPEPETEAVAVGVVGSPVKMVGFVAPQVRGAVARLLKLVSVTRASIFSVVLFGALIVFPGMPLIRNEIDCTGQVVNVIGALFAPPTDAKTCVIPGVFAATITSPVRFPDGSVWGVSVTTAGVTAVQVICPTVEVMSTPALNACA